MKRINLILIISILVLIIVGSLVVLFVFGEEGKENQEKINPSEVIENYSQLVEGISYRGGTYLNFSGTIYDYCLSRDEMKMILEMKRYNTSEKIMNFVNEEFEIVEGENLTILSVFETYEKKAGSEYDILRVVLNMLLENGYQGVYFVYEYGGDVNAVINFRDIEKPMYYYFEHGELKMAHHGWSFKELILAEEKRQGILIDRFGTLGEKNLLERKNLNLLDVYEWGDRDEWVN
jgi:hypothetical protein